MLYDPIEEDSGVSSLCLHILTTIKDGGTAQHKTQTFLSEITDYIIPSLQIFIEKKS